MTLIEKTLDITRKIPIYALGSLIALGVFACDKKISKPNNLASPLGRYLSEMKYPYDEERGVVIFPDSSECDGWKFFQGECGQEWTYCERFAGGKIESREDKCDNYTSKGAVCVFPNSTECCEQKLVYDECEH